MGAENVRETKTSRDASQQTTDLDCKKYDIIILWTEVFFEKIRDISSDFLLCTMVNHRLGDYFLLFSAA